MDIHLLKIPESCQKYPFLGFIAICFEQKTINNSKILEKADK